MPSVAESARLLENIVRLRRAERVAAVATDVAPVRRDLESRLGQSLSRSRAAMSLGVSQAALDRWARADRVPIVVTPGGRREVPRRFVIEVREAIDELKREGRRGRLLAAALAKRREAADRLAGGRSSQERRSVPTPSGHRTAERRSRAYHAIVAKRLDEQLVEEARAQVERLASEGHLHPRYAERWLELLDQPIAEIARVISSDTQTARDLRQNSPFAGVLNEQERRRIIEAVH